MKHDPYKKEKTAMAAIGIERANQRLGNRGFTLLEVIIALAIFSIGIMGVASLQVSSTNGDFKARLATEAATAAHDQAEKLLSLSYDPDAPTEEFFDTTVTGFASFPTSRSNPIGRYTVDWIVEPLTDAEVIGPLTPRALRITVRANWEYFGNAKRYQLEFVKIADI